LARVLRRGGEAAAGRVYGASHHPPLALPLIIRL